MRTSASCAVKLTIASGKVGGESWASPPILFLTGSAWRTHWTVRGSFSRSLADSFALIVLLGSMSVELDTARLSIRGQRLGTGFPDQKDDTSSAAPRRLPSGSSIPNQVAVVSCLWPQIKA